MTCRLVHCARDRERKRSFYTDVTRRHITNNKMKDNVEFNIEFITEVEKNPPLYNYKLTDYSDRRKTEAIWTKIGDKFNEKAYECRKKWKSIRSAYIRTLNAKSKNHTDLRKDYYLAPYLQFLNPFTKSRPREGNIAVVQENERQQESQLRQPSNCTESEASSVDEDSLKHEPQSPAADSSTSNPLSLTPTVSLLTPSSAGKRLREADKHAIDYLTLKKRKLKKKLQYESPQKDPCEMFLLSLVPHMASMSPRQQLTFQKGVLELIENIKY